jgi:dipeptidyl aminopeptidase/acylaminoacyl peptidase
VIHDEPFLIPRRVLFGNPDRMSVAASPDGRRLAWIAPVDGIREVWVAPIGDVAAARPVTQDRRRGIPAFVWSHSDEHLLYVQDEAGDENWHVLAVDLSAGTTLDLTPVSGVQARIAGRSMKRPFEVVIALNDRDPRYHDLHVVDVRTGARTLLLRNDRFIDFTLDGDFRVLFAVEPNPAGGRRILRRDADGSFQPFADVPAEDEMTTGVEGTTFDGSLAYVVDSRGRDTAALFEHDLATGARRLVAEDPRADADGTLRHPVTRRVQAVSFNRLREEWRVLDADVAPDLAALAKLGDGEVRITSRTRDDRLWTVVLVRDDGPWRYYLWDRAARSATFLFTNRTALEGVALSKMRAFEIRARDGLSLPSYLTLPPGEGERPGKPLAMVLYVHGGPWARDAWGPNPVHQWLANRGYAVLSVNYRGSTGFGKSFVNAADHEWAGKMHDDLVDAVRWAVENGVADPTRVAISGGSYGGYAALVGLTFTPELFACGVDIVGPSSIVTLIRSAPPYWQPLIAMMKRRVGDPDTADGLAFLNSRSPITHVSKIVRPLLVAQGANDPRVKQAESDQIVAEMKSRAIPVSYVLFPDEGHGFARPENSMAFRAVEEAFLAKHLGGRQEPIGEDLAGSTAQILAGRDQIPGLGVEPA